VPGTACNYISKMVKSLLGMRLSRACSARDRLVETCMRCATSQLSMAGSAQATPRSVISSVPAGTVKTMLISLRAKVQLTGQRAEMGSRLRAYVNRYGHEVEIILPLKLLPLDAAQFNTRVVELIGRNSHQVAMMALISARLVILANFLLPRGQSGTINSLWMQTNQDQPGDDGPLWFCC